MQKYKEINGNDYVKDSRTTINETMQSIQSMNSGTAFPTNNLFEGMKCYRTDLKKTYTLTDAENGTWVEDAHASLSDEATHAAAADTATKVNATVPSDKVGELVKAKMGDNDAFRIAVGGSAKNGWVELATADDGTESIYVRQYADVKIDGFVTPTRTATLLDGSGNTSFPGKVTAPNFIGSLNGNAATATKLQTPRTLSLTGKATGSATFDGSANAAINVTSVNADTASKLSTARKINITGNASGAATFDGSGDININTTVNESKHAAAADVVRKAIQPRGVYGDKNYIFYGTLTIPQGGEFFKLEVLGGSGFNASLEQSREGTLYFRTGNGDPADYAAYSEYHRNGAGNFKFFVAKDSGTQYRIYSGLTSYTGIMQVIPYVGQNSSFDLALTTVSALPDGAVEVEQQQLIYADTVNKYAPTKTGAGASGTWGISITGNAATASKLATPRTLALTGKAAGSATFDGSSNASINVTSVNADTAINDAKGQKIDITYEKIADASNAHTSLQNSINTKLDKTGGTATGAIVAPSFQTGNDDNNYFQCRKFRGEGNANTYYHAIDFGYGGHDQVDFYECGGIWNFWHSKGSAKGGTLVGSIKQSGWNGNVVGNVTGNATTATKLQTARTISLTGNASGSTTFDGSADISISTTVNESKHAVNADSATKLATARAISLTGNASGSANFDGSGNVSINTTVSKAAAADSATNADKVDGYHVSDLLDKITASNTGIVAASLTENGYVKFANGLILQWGNASGDDEGGNSNTTFPIAFPSTCFVVLLTSKSYNNCLLSQSKTGFTWKASSGHISWAALGR